MRFFSTIATLALAAAVTAQSSTSAESSSTTSSMSPEQTCLAKCGAADICCQAACVNVPCPSPAQANTTTECAAKCPQGNGTEQETQQYASCQASCISSYFLTTATGAAAATGGSASTTSGQTFTFGGSSASRTGSGSASATGSKGTSTASASGNAAAETRAAIAGAGLFGLIIAGLAL